MAAIYGRSALYLHLGQNVVVPESSVIGIFDMDNTTGSRVTHKFLSDAEKAGRVINVTDELPKSFVLCCEETNTWRPAAQSSGKKGRAHGSSGMRVYLSQLSSQTLLKRTGTMQFT